jgi:hypothetical protein
MAARDPDATAGRAFLPERTLALPFTVTNRPGPVVEIVAAESIVSYVGIDDPKAANWIQGFNGRVIIDFSAVPVVHSPLCSWLVSILTAAKPSPLSVVGANQRVAQTLRLLRLDTLMDIA